MNALIASETTKVAPTKKGGNCTQIAPMSGRRDRDDLSPVAVLSHSEVHGEVHGEIHSEIDGKIDGEIRGKSTATRDARRPNRRRSGCRADVERRGGATSKATQEVRLGGKIKMQPATERLAMPDQVQLAARIGDIAS